MNYEIFNLWPVPIYRKNIGMNKEHEDIVKDYKWKKMKSGSGHVTETLSILEDDRLADLKQSIIGAVDEFANSHYKVKNKFKTIASWALKTEPQEIAGFGEYHNHSNCVLSASYYFTRTPESGGISFERNLTMNPLIAPNFEFEVEEETLDNTSYVNLEPVTGDLLVFPSYLYHKPIQNMSNQDRLSLGCNLFPQGLSYRS